MTDDLNKKRHEEAKKAWDKRVEEHPHFAKKG